VAGQIYYSPRWKKMIGRGGTEVEPTLEAWLNLVHPEDVPLVQERIQDHLEGSSSHIEVEYRLKHANGCYRWMLARGIAIRDEEGAPSRMAGSQTDIHDRRRTEEQLRHLALHDRLTGLPNRTLLLDRLGRIVVRARSSRTRMAVLHIGMDRFKKINESLGPEVGDQVLVEVGKRFSGLAASVFRVEGDEFVIVLEEVSSLREATGLAERVLREHGAPLRLHDREVLVRFSIGITVGPQGYREPAELLRDAQTAMHRAKAQGRARFETFDREMHKSVEEDLHLQTELFQALEAGQLLLWYQPVYDLRTREIIGFEALARWKHPERGMIQPGRFIPLAEETGQIVELSRWLFESAFNCMSRWQENREHQDELSLNMNLSPKHLFHPGLERDLAALLRRTGADPSRIHLEITESSFIDNPKAAAKVLDRLKRWGFKIALDDFGTGFSSLSMLHDLPFDILKIDRSFVSKLGVEPDVHKIVRTIVGLARALDLDVVAEGVETEEQLAELRSMRCRFGQGFLLGKPMPVDEAERLISSTRREMSEAPVTA
jgi:diguanylate cyclase (GGDEF)-like protein/PAS domain S-box-containing protein